MKLPAGTGDTVYGSTGPLDHSTETAPLEPGAPIYQRENIRMGRLRVWQGACTGNGMRREGRSDSERKRYGNTNQ
jgi:hypothetical protein